MLGNHLSERHILLSVGLRPFNLSRPWHALLGAYRLLEDCGGGETLSPAPALYSVAWRAGDGAGCPSLETTSTKRKFDTSTLPREFPAAVSSLQIVDVEPCDEGDARPD